MRGRTKLETSFPNSSRLYIMPESDKALNKKSGMSNLPRCLSTGCLGIYLIARTKTSSPTGTFRKNIQCHEK